MADDKSKTDYRDRDRVAGGEQYEVAYFAKKHGLSMAQATEIISLAGPSREKADAAVERARKSAA